MTSLDMTASTLQVGAHRQNFEGLVPRRAGSQRRARSQHPPRENPHRSSPRSKAARGPVARDLGGNLAVLELPQTSYPPSHGWAGPARLGPRNEVVAAAGIGGGGWRSRYRGWVGATRVARRVEATKVAKRRTALQRSAGGQAATGPRPGVEVAHEGFRSASKLTTQ